MNLASDSCDSATVFMYTFIMQLACTSGFRGIFKFNSYFIVKSYIQFFHERNTPFRFEGGKPSDKAMFPGWPDRVLVFLAKTLCRALVNE